MEREDLLIIEARLEHLKEGMKLIIASLLALSEHLGMDGDQTIEGILSPSDSSSPDEQQSQ